MSFFSTTGTGIVTFKATRTIFLIKYDNNVHLCNILLKDHFFHDFPDKYHNFFVLLMFQTIVLSISIHIIILLLKIFLQWLSLKIFNRSSYFHLIHQTEKRTLLPIIQNYDENTLVILCILLRNASRNFTTLL